VTEAIGKLCIGGDAACVQGDFVTLRNVVLQLAAYVPEPIHCELAALASACTCAPDRAAQLWDELKTRIYRAATA
jgi:hypothetical protein